MQFYRDQLGFTLVADYRFESGERFVLAEPADGSTGLAPITPNPGSAKFPRVGKSSETVLV